MPPPTGICEVAASEVSEPEPDPEPPAWALALALPIPPEVSEGIGAAEVSVPPLAGPFAELEPPELLHAARPTAARPATPATPPTRSMARRSSGMTAGTASAATAWPQQGRVSG